MTYKAANLMGVDVWKDKVGVYRIEMFAAAEGDTIRTVSKSYFSLPTARNAIRYYLKTGYHVDRGMLRKDGE